MTQADADSRAAERWFLDRGLPSVLTTRERLRAVWPRSAPAIAGFAVLVTCLTVMNLLPDDPNAANKDAPMTPADWAFFVVAFLALPLAVAIGWLVAHKLSDRWQSIAAAAAVLLVVAADIINGDDADGVASDLVLVLFLIALTALGIGSVLGWASRLTWAQLRGTGALMVGVLPVVLLIVLVFFNTYVWVMATAITPRRLWLLLAMLALIAVTFVVSRTLEQAAPTLRSASAAGKHAERLAGTPFERMIDPPEADPLTRGERFNVVFILVATQIAQILMVAVVAAAIFFVVGLVVASPAVMDKWAHGGSLNARMFGLNIPAPQPLINMTLFLAALTFMYISARAVTDAEYRTQFLTPVIADLKLTMLARARYHYDTRAKMTPRPAAEK